MVAAFDAGYQAGAFGVGFQERRLEAGFGEEGGDVLGGGSLAGAGVVAGVRGVDAEQVAADVDDLVLRGGRVRCHRFIVPLGMGAFGWPPRAAAQIGRVRHFA